VKTRTELWDTSCWHLIHTHPRQEARAEYNLKTLNVETYVPVCSVKRRRQFSCNGSRDYKPLFPRYVFARFKINDLYHKVRFTRGVHDIVCFDKSPAIVDEEVICLIRSREDRKGWVRLQEFNVGDRVAIKEGRPLERLEAVFDRVKSDNQRVVLLLETVGFQARIEVDLDSIERAATSLSVEERPYAPAQFQRWQEHRL
jgi:transcription elongation factor/antiterminator RfaH